METQHTKVSVKGYKVMNPDWTCRGFKYEVGQTYKHDGDIGLCSSGFHFCKQPQHCFNYYSFSPYNIICEVEAIGKVIHGDDKSVTNQLKILRKLEWQEVLEVANTGSNNTGHSNSGNWNSGNWNSGYSNSGDSNTGYRNSGDSNTGDSNTGYSNSGDSNTGDSNSGDSNSGDRNSGYRNSGNWNSGYRNSGNWNSGDRNSGDSNSGYRNSGAFCTDNNPKIILFDMPCDMTVKEWEQSRAYDLMYNLESHIWVPTSHMSDKEKESFPSHETTGGFLKKKTLKEAWADMWGNISEDDQTEFTSLPNFDSEKFFDITGIKVEQS